MQYDFALNMAGVIVTLAFFVLVAYIVTILRATTRLAVVIASVAALVGALPAILFALYGLQ